MEKQKTTDAVIREAVNPVFYTARACVTVNALLGDKDAAKLIGPLGFDLSFLNLGLLFPDGQVVEWNVIENLLYG